MAPDDLSIEPRDYDAHGNAYYGDDLLDLRWEHLIEHEIREAREDLRLPFEAAINDLLYTDDVDLIRRGVEIIGLLAERHIRRLAHPALLDEESGIARYREMRVAELRAHRERYAELAGRAGWPEDPADLDDKQLDHAILHVLLPHLLGDGARFERPPDT